jgi:hypothetical protein
MTIAEQLHASKTHCIGKIGKPTPAPNLSRD